MHLRRVPHVAHRHFGWALGPSQGDQLDGQLHRADDDRCVLASDLQYAADLPVQRAHLDRVPHGDRRAFARRQRPTLSLHGAFFLLESLENVGLPRCELLSAAARRLAELVDGRVRGRSALLLELLDGAVDLGPRFEHVAPRLLTARLLGDALPLAHVPFALHDHLDAVARVVSHRRGLALPRLELRLLRLEPLDERRHVALTLGNPLFRTRHHLRRQVEASGNADTV